MKTLILAISLLYSISHAEESITPSQSEQAKVVPPSTKTNKLIVDDKTLTSETLDPNSITGILGTPLHTIQLIVCKVTDMSFTGGKADESRLGIQILTVGGKALSKKRYMYMPQLPDNRTPKHGDIYRFYVYETIETAGYPTEAFTQLGISPIATQELHFRPKLVVLKEKGKP